MSYILSTSLNQVTMYYEKFRTRLSALHNLHLKRLINYMEAIQKVMEDWKATRSKAGSSADARTEVFTISSFMEKLGRKAVGINLLEIEAYLKRSKVNCIALHSTILSMTIQIARKISSYADAVSSQDGRSRPSRVSHFRFRLTFSQTPCPRSRQTEVLHRSILSKHSWSGLWVQEKVISSVLSS